MPLHLKGYAALMTIVQCHGGDEIYWAEDKFLGKIWEKLAEFGQI